MMSLANKTALLTGALGSLGQAQAQALARAGANVILWDRPDRPDGEEFASKLTDASGTRMRYVGLDLNKLADADAAARALDEEFGGIDILINNAALIINRPFEAFSLDEYEEQVRVNSSAAFALARALAPSMKKKRYGKIVNFCSITLNGRWDGYVPYVTSKGAMLGLTKTLARELGDRLKQYNDWILENQCLKERIQPSTVAELVLFLVSPASDMITGQNIAIDGGW